MQKKLKPGKKQDQLDQGNTLSTIWYCEQYKNIQDKMAQTLQILVSGFWDKVPDNLKSRNKLKVY